MTRSTTSHNKQLSLPRRVWRGVWVAALWLGVWQLAAIWVDQQILLVSPLRVMLRLAALTVTAAFWKTVGFTMLCIICGFLLAFASGVLLAALTAWKDWLRAIIRPPIAVMKSTPVASVTILALLLMSSSRLSVFIAFLMSLPVFYYNTLEGIERTDTRLLEMAHVFRVPAGRRFMAIYVRGVMPYTLSAAASALGIAWKSGVSAEVIGQVSGSIGLRLYLSKLYLETADLFAWTAVIILLSLLMEAAFRRLLRLLQA